MNDVSRCCVCGAYDNNQTVLVGRCNRCGYPVCDDCWWTRACCERFRKKRTMPSKRSDELHIKYERLSEVTKLDGNPKRHDVATVAVSMLRFGFRNPLLVDSKGTLIAGHGRCAALELIQEKLEAGDTKLGGWDLKRPHGVRENLKSGEWLVPVVRGAMPFKSKAERDAYVIADNQTTIAGGWDPVALDEMMDQFDNFDGLGFDDGQLAKYLGAGDDDGSPTPPETFTPVTVEVTVICPNCGKSFKSAGGKSKPVT